MYVYDIRLSRQSESEDRRPKKSVSVTEFCLYDVYHPQMSNYPSKKKRAQLNVLRNEQRGVHEYLKCGKISWQTPSWWGGAGCPRPKNLTPVLCPSGLEPRGTRPLFTPLSWNPEYAPAKPLEISVFKLFMSTVVISGKSCLNKRTRDPDLP